MSSVRFFPLSNVRLLGGPFRTVQDMHAGFLLSVEPDRMLAPFRQQAGLVPRAERYGGWESRDISGHSLGHYLSALCFLYAATGDEVARDRIGYIVGEIGACQQANGDGYVLPVAKEAFDKVRQGIIDATPFSLNGVWVPFYTLHKMLAGLRDAFRLSGNEQALGIARGVADWLEGVLAGLSATQIEQMLGTEHGGMNEVLADLSADTGDRRYLEMAARCFHHEQVLAPMFRGEDRLNGLHGNTQIPKVVGLAREFELTGITRYHVAATSFWEHVVHGRSYCIGGHGESEHFFPVEQFPRRLTPNTCETCNTYNLLKLTRHLFEWKPEAAEMDFVERAMINHLLANIGRAPGEFGYFLGLGAVGVKVFSTPYDSWWCCVGTGLENPVRYGEQIYARCEDELWVNLYLGSSLEWREKGVSLRQETCFPDEDMVRLSLVCERPIVFALLLRHPHWCARPEIWVNGEPVEFVSTPASYIRVEREWRTGDRLSMRLPMTLRTEALPHADGKILAVLFGPSVLAAVVPAEPGVPDPSKLRFAEHLQARGKTDGFPPVFVADSVEEVLSGLRPTGRAFAEFHSEGVLKPSDLLLVPFHRIYEEHYVVYFPLIRQADWERRQGEIREEMEARQRLEAGTLDSVTPGYQQPEVEHELQSHQSRIEEFSDRKSREAYDGGWFSYIMAVDPADAVSLVVTYWGGVWHKRTFDILVDGRHLATESLLTNRPGEFFDQVYAIPAGWTAGKCKIIVRFESRGGDTAGGVFLLRVMRSSAAPAAYHAGIVFKDH